MKAIPEWQWVPLYQWKNCWQWAQASSMLPNVQGSRDGFERFELRFGILFGANYVGRSCCLIKKILTRPLNLRRANLFTLNYDTLIEKAADAEGAVLLNP